MDDGITDTEDSGQDSGPDSEQENGPEQGELSGNTLMTRAAGDEGHEARGAEPARGEGHNKGKDDKDKDETAGEKGSGADEVPDKPEGYALKFADTVQVDKQLLGGFRKAAHEMGIRPSQAQKLADMYVAHAAGAWQRTAEAQQRAVVEAKRGWEEEIRNSPGFVSERAHIQGALRQFGDRELYDLLDRTNLGAHPRMWKFMANIGKALAEPGFKGKNSGRSEKTAAEVLYPDMNH